MGLNSKFLKKYKKEMSDAILSMNPDFDKDKVGDIVEEMMKENMCNPRVTLDNNYTGETRDTTLLSVFDWVLERKPIICGNATFYKNQHESINPIAKMLENFLTDRKKYKKLMFQVEDATSAKYKDLDRSY